MCIFPGNPANDALGRAVGKSAGVDYDAAAVRSSGGGGGGGGRQFTFGGQRAGSAASSRMPASERMASGRSTMARPASGSNTVLTSGSGVSAMSPTSNKTLLGQ